MATVRTPGADSSLGTAAATVSCELPGQPRTAILRSREPGRFQNPLTGLELGAYGDLATPDVRDQLARAPDPAGTARLPRPQCMAALKRARRRVEDKAAALHTEHLAQPPAVGSLRGDGPVTGQHDHRLHR